MKNNFFIGSTLANDPHTEGLHNAAKIAKLVNINSILIEPSLSLDNLCNAIKKFNPKYIGLSYRLSSEIGCLELEKAINYFVNTGLLKHSDDVKIIFAGLPETINALKSKISQLPLTVILCSPHAESIDRAIDTLEFFDSINNEEVIRKLREELIPIKIPIFDQIAEEVISNDNYKSIECLKVPSTRAINSYVERIKESNGPILRTHFGVPSNDIEPTIEGIKRISEAKVIDELSLGSSDLSQRYFGEPEMFLKYKNDGGVPYKTISDLEKLFQASRRGNYPSIKPYCHVRDIVNFIDQCISVGLLKGAHQAIPLFWFNELDGRGVSNIRDSINEHFSAVRKLASLGIPVEMNDPNQWSSRLAHDTIIVSSYALISATMTMCGVKDMVLQFQFNKPKETGDYADLAKMKAGLFMANEISKFSRSPISIFRETRTGIESLSSDMVAAKKQLARSTLLQMCLDPHIIHVVSYCEANYAAKPKDIIDSSKLVRKAVKLFKENREDILNVCNSPIIDDRYKFLVNESSYLLSEIAQLHQSYSPYYQSLADLCPYLGNEDVIIKSIEKKIISAPGIINTKYKSDYITKPMKYGMINVVDNYNNPNIMSEKERVKLFCNV